MDSFSKPPPIEEILHVSHYFTIEDFQKKKTDGKKVFPISIFFSQKKSKYIEYGFVFLKIEYVDMVTRICFPR